LHKQAEPLEPASRWPVVFGDHGEPLQDPQRVVPDNEEAEDYGEEGAEEEDQDDASDDHTA